MLSGGSAPDRLQRRHQPEQVGLGVQVGSIDKIMTAGSFQTTGNALDVAIQGDGFLVVGRRATAGRRHLPPACLPAVRSSTRAAGQPDDRRPGLPDHRRAAST